MPGHPTRLSRLAKLRRYMHQSHPRFRLGAIAVISNIAALLYGFDVGAIGAIVDAICSATQKEKWLIILADSTGLQGTVLSMVFVGAWLICSYGCWFGFGVGRKDELMLSSIMYGIGALTIAVSDDLTWDSLAGILVLLLGRLLYGFGLGLAVGSLTTYLGEIAPGDLRGALLAGVEVVQVTGILLGSVLGAAMASPLHSYFVAAVLAFVQLCGLMVLPESPRYMLAHPESYTRGDAMLSIRYLDPNATFDDLHTMQQEVSPKSQQAVVAAAAAAGRRGVGGNGVAGGGSPCNGKGGGGAGNDGGNRGGRGGGDDTGGDGAGGRGSAFWGDGTAVGRSADASLLLLPPARPSPLGRNRGKSLSAHDLNARRGSSGLGGGGDVDLGSGGGASDDVPAAAASTATRLSVAGGGASRRPGMRARANTVMLTTRHVRILSVDALEQVAQAVVGLGDDGDGRGGVGTGDGPGHVFESEFRRHLTIAFCLVCCRQLTGFTIIIFYADVIWTAIGAGDEYVGVLSTGATRLIGVLLAASFMERLPRKALLLQGTAAMGVSCALLAVALRCSDDNGEGGWLAVTVGTVAILSINFWFECPVGTLMFVLLGEIFPTPIRREGISFSIAANFCVAALWVFLLPVMRSWMQLWGMFALSAAICAACVVAARALVVETVGKSLAEIQRDIANAGAEFGLKIIACDSPITRPTTYSTRSGGGPPGGGGLSRGPFGGDSDGRNSSDGGGGGGCGPPWRRPLASLDEDETGFQTPTTPLLTAEFAEL